VITEDRSGLSPAAEDRLGWLTLLAGTDAWRIWWATVLNDKQFDLSVLTIDQRDRLGRALQILSRR
jgi:hypothetical protein